MFRFPDSALFRHANGNPKINSAYVVIGWVKCMYSNEASLGGNGCMDEKNYLAILLRVKDAASKNGTPLVAYNPQNWKCMTWDFISTGANTYQIENLLTHNTFQPQTTAANRKAR